MARPEQNLETTQSTTKPTDLAAIDRIEYLKQLTQSERAARQATPGTASLDNPNTAALYPPSPETRQLTAETSQQPAWVQPVAEQKPATTPTEANRQPNQQVNQGDATTYQAPAWVRPVSAEQQTTTAAAWVQPVSAEQRTPPTSGS